MRKLLLTTAALLALSITPSFAADTCAGKEGVLVQYHTLAKKHGMALSFAKPGVIQSYIAGFNKILATRGEGPVAGNRFAIIVVPNQDAIWGVVVQDECVVISRIMTVAQMKRLSDSVDNAGS
jgi:hypothetical protein